MNELLEQLKALKKSAQPCVLKYGESRLEGTILDLTAGVSGRVWVKAKIGEYAIPLSQVRSVVALDG